MSLLLVKLPPIKVRLEWLKLDGCFYLFLFFFFFSIFGVFLFVSLLFWPKNNDLVSAIGFYSVKLQQEKAVDIIIFEIKIKI